MCVCVCVRMRVRVRAGVRVCVSVRVPCVHAPVRVDVRAYTLYIHLPQRCYRPPNATP